MWRLNQIPGYVIIEPAKKAIQDVNSCQARLVSQTDGSKLSSGKTGAAVVSKDRRLNIWRKRQRYLGEKKQPDDAELWAIFEALEVVIKETDNFNTTSITVFTDSKAALTKIQENGRKSAIKDFLYQRATELVQSGHVVVFQWVPGHSKIEENERADLAAKEVAYRGGKETECWSSLAHVRTELKRTTLDELSTWHLLKTQEREVISWGFYISRAKFGIDPTLGKAPKKYAAQYYQLKIGHGAVGMFLAKIGAIESPKFWWCNTREQTVVNLYAKCRRWRKERGKLIRELGKLGITWEAHAERKWLASLLANDAQLERC